ncbi:unnamed protein product [Vitrella brassicaformis CCMP3155]|uniref:Uncharacterized protein n=2 Tax=Vitrella brassicaformis TaxID=1169539 RepID=A0A0G4EM96_VITBC|nr:unnamed protein product [Vitrella brassicaformis CCMP3155]|eukprot:CEL98284.1 unnamed protein product [Vitrella brassicaformis CCMP3155]
MSESASVGTKRPAEQVINGQPDGPANAPTSVQQQQSGSGEQPKKLRRSRWGQAPSDVDATAAAQKQAQPQSQNGPSSAQPPPPSSAPPPAAAAAAAVPFDVSLAKKAMEDALAKAKEAAAQKEAIQRRLMAAQQASQQAATPTPAPPAALPLSGGLNLAVLQAQQQQALQLQLAKAKAQAQAQLQAGMHRAMGAQGAMRPLRVDEFGREVDEEGKVVPIKPQLRSTLKVNINREKEERIKKKPFARVKPDKSVVDPKKNPFFDPNVRGGKKARRGFHFVEEGTYVKREQQILKRAEAKALGIDLQKLHAEKQARAKEESAALKKEQGEGDEEFNPNLIPLGGLGPAMKLPTLFPKQEEGEEGPDLDLEGEEEERVSLSPSLRADRVVPVVESIKMRPREIIPEVEWWDKPILKAKTDQEGVKREQEGEGEDFNWVINTDKITHYVEHPVPIKPAAEADSTVTPTMYLTQKERKKLRRRRRQEKEQEKQDKIKMGLIPPPPPKVKLSNLMKVLGNEAVADPSKIEKQVKHQMEKRIKDHEARNVARQLAPEERKKKKISKWQSSSGVDFEVAIFTVKNFESRRNVYKVDINAQQFHLTGACVICPAANTHCVIVEGGPRSIKRYKKLMLRRIKWEEGSDAAAATKGEEADTNMSGGNAEGDDDEEDEDDETGKKGSSTFCQLVWQGVVATRAFKNWRVYNTKGEFEAKKIFSDRHVESYWDMVKKFRPAEADI